MSNTISSYGTPTGSVFGKLGETIGTSEGKAYYKRDYDTLNIGWGDPLVPTPLPTPTPTSTPPPVPANAFGCTQLEATGSIKYNNELKLQWSGDISNINCFATWSRAASPNDPVNISGLFATASLKTGETRYGPFTVLNLPAATFNFGITRPSSSIDTASIQINAFGAGKIRSARLFGYSSSSSDLVLKANGITGNYVFHSRNSSGNLFGGTGGFISSVISQSLQQTVTASVDNSISTHLLEIVSYNGVLSFVPIEIRQHVSQVPPQSPSHSVWLNYDNLGIASATWISYDDTLTIGATFIGTPYSVCPSFNGLCVRTGSFAVLNGSNYRQGSTCVSPDPRTVSYQIDATTNLNGEYNFNYLDPYGVTRNANGNGAPNTTIYAIACGYSIVNSVRGVAQVSSRFC